MRIVMAFLLMGVMFAGLMPASAQEPPVPLCTPQQNEQMFFFDDFRLDNGWETNNDVQLPNQWQESEIGVDDANAWYVGRGIGGGETGYLSNPAGRAWNYLTSPTIDANLWEITCVQVDIMGSSEGTSDGSNELDWLQIDVFMPGLSGDAGGVTFWQGVGSYSGQSRGAAYTTVGAPIQPGLDVSTPPIQTPLPPPLGPEQRAGGDYTKIRIGFTADETVDSFSPPCTRESYEANGNQCIAGTGSPNPAVPKVPGQNMAGYGWFVDNVRIYGTPIPPQEPPSSRHRDRLNEFPDEGPEIESFDVELQRIDIIRDAGQMIPISIRAKDNTGVANADVFLIQGNNEIQVNLRQDDARPRDWIGELAVDDVRLLVGEWIAVGFVADERGNLTRTEETFTLTVTATDAHLYPLDLGLAGRDLQANPEVSLAAGGSVQAVLEKETPILRDIRFQVVRPGYLTPPPTPMGAPYVLTAEQLPQGEFELALVARDRAHQVGYLNVPIVNDQTNPVFGVIVPPVTYQNVEFPLTVWVKEQTSHEVRFQMDGELLVSTTELPSGTHMFNFTRTSIEDGAQYKVTVRDKMSNTKVLFGSLDTIMAPADATVQLATVPSEPRYMPGDQVQVLATLTDNGNPRDYPYEVLFMHEGEVLGSYMQTLAPGVQTNFLHAINKLPPGMHNVQAFARTDTSYPFELNEFLDETEEDDITFEVYMGKVTYENKTFYIRADARQQPYQAVDLEFDFEYDLRLVQGDNGTRYYFNAGDDQLYWDPLQQTTEIEGPEQEPAPPREVPGVPIVALLAVLALAARRKS